jgi:acetyl/propionyl-CoA carboxylase alpha subunit
MKFSITVNSKAFEIELSPQEHEPVPTSVIINGRKIPLSLSLEWEKEFPKHLIIDDKPYESEFEYGEDGFPKRMWLNGTPCDVRADFLGKEKLSKVKDSSFLVEGRDNAIKSPMPGKIVKILVKDGQKVNAGELCILLEAMKMENELESMKSAIVRKVHVRENDLVDLEQILITFEDEDDLFF